MPSPTPRRPLFKPTPCVGVRGLPLDNSPDDELLYEEIDTDYPVPFSGSQADLGLGLTWMSADGRYGPYGFGEKSANYTRSKVDWDKVDWGELMDACSAANAHRFPQAPLTSRLASEPRFVLFNKSTAEAPPRWDQFSNTRRTMLILRSYDGFRFKPESMWYIRSLITEASLRRGGEYSVVLLHNLKNLKPDIYKSKKAYDKVLDTVGIPPELRSITVLWDDTLLKSWYAAVGEHRAMWQVNQPTQLFALFYPEYDHYWQIELDIRFLGDAGEYLDAVSTSARYEPRKQALERASFVYRTQESGTYKEFMSAVDKANGGQSRSWGPINVREVTPIGPKPPVSNPDHDNFSWGVGEDADVIVTGPCGDARTTAWAFGGYVKGFGRGGNTPRFWCPPAIARASRTLLHAIHADQHLRGLAIPSESVFPTWALWLGLKISFPPQPAYMRGWTPRSEINNETSHQSEPRRVKKPKKWFGFLPEESPDGMGWVNPQSSANGGHTFWWGANYPRRIMDTWLSNKVNIAADSRGVGMPYMLRVKDGIVYAPNFAMHPVKK
ncbi:hypothetical protein B0I35DRAFT_448761 [Stachybotrys elegans]|uniref:Uncharacterized protein n=1 Tax=Stachybotrys elegans TaxID=80388 RepID=A0A8K0SYM7_9HYPO|nr:hypothetical protein B0I35DRAFT_448761 [Stachybotrys elegans]